MILVAFALPQESRDFRERLQAAHGCLGKNRVTVAHLGVGAAAARQSIQSCLGRERPEAVICAGFAGGLDPRLVVGDVVIAENHLSEPFLQTVPAWIDEKQRRFSGKLVSVEKPVEIVADKKVLAARTGALAVDMETAAVAEECRAARVPFLAVRVISDPVETELPIPFGEWFDLEKQRPLKWGLLTYLLRNPDRVGPFANFLRGLAPARRVLADFLVEFLAKSSELTSPGTEDGAG